MSTGRMDDYSPDELLDAVDQEVREQSLVDHTDEDPATKARRRDEARQALDDELEIEQDPGPNPA